MTVRNLERLLAPASVALLGASRKPRSVGEVIARNLLRGGFGGPILPIHREHRSIEGALSYPNVAALPIVPDLAVIATPPDTVPPLIAELGARGTKAAVVITAGFGEGGSERGRRLRQAALDAARPHLLRIVGPNCVGVMVPRVGLNASFAHIPARSGQLAFVTQSGAIATTVLDWADARGIGFSHVVSLGDMVDVDFGDMLDYLALDPETKAILLYIEAVTHARKFMSAARAAARLKPVIAIKAGRHAEGARAAASHTGALAGSDRVYEAALQRAGVLRVRDLDELFDAVETLARAQAPRGDRLAIVTNGGGLGVIATDQLVDEGGQLAELSPATIELLDGVLPQTWSRNNPVDIIGDAGGDRYAAALVALKDDPNVDAVLALNCPVAVASGLEAAEALVATTADRGSSLFASWVGEGAQAKARALLRQKGVPSYDTPSKAVRGFMHILRHRRSQEELAETPPSIPEFATDALGARSALATAASEGREMLNEWEAKRVLAAYDIPTVETRVAATPTEAAAAAADLAVPVALKIVSPDITHKSDVGGVQLRLKTPVEVESAAAAMARRVADLKPTARLAGFTVQPMIEPQGAHELIVGISVDQVFGPIVLFGQGGTAVEQVADTAIALPPLNLNLANRLIRRTRAFNLLKGYRDRPAADLGSIALTLVKVAQMAADLADLVELDINPLLAGAQGAIALDARIRVSKASLAPAERLAIRPYPKELEQEGVLADGERIGIRPVRPEDEPAFHAAFQHVSAKDIRMRFFTPLKHLTHAMAARLTQIDYDREMALVAVRRTPGATPGVADIVGVVRLAADPDNAKAEYAVLVRTDFQGRGLGRLLMERLLAVARQRGIGELFGEVLAENVRMLDLARRFGFAAERLAEDSAIVCTRLRLAPRT